MFRGVTEYFLALLDVLEAEGRSAKRNVMSLAMAIGIFTLGILLFAGAAGFLVTALYLGLSAALSPAWAALVSGAALVAMGGITVWIARTVAR